MICKKMPFSVYGTFFPYYIHCLFCHYCRKWCNFLVLEKFHKKAKNAYVTVSEDEADIFYTPGNEDNLCGYHDGVLNQYYTLITCNSAITGQFVQIQLNTTDFLNLYEVEVHGL